MLSIPPKKSFSQTVRIDFSTKIPSKSAPRDFQAFFVSIVLFAFVPYLRLPTRTKAPGEMRGCKSTGVIEEIFTQ
jgi:hypothetical protein